MPDRPLALTGATGRLARLLRPGLPGAAWLGRGACAADVAGHGTLVALAGVTRGDAAALAANTDCALWALEAARAHGVGRVLLLSSAAVYGRAAPPLSADRAPEPASAYGAAKAAMEAAARDWARAHADGPEVTVLRLGNVAGADALLGGLWPGAAPRIHIWADDATPRRSYIGPVSLARVLRALANADVLPAILNVAAPGAVAMGDLARAAGHDWRAIPAPDDAIREVRLDTAALERLVPLGAATAEGLVAEWRAVTA